MPAQGRIGHPWGVLTGVIIHLANDLPIMVDLEELPAGGDRSIRCTNVRTLDGKRPPFVHDRHSTFILPLGVLRLIEVPSQAGAVGHTGDQDPVMESPAPAQPEFDPADDEAEEDLLARIRQI